MTRPNPRKGQGDYSNLSTEYKMQDELSYQSYMKMTLGPTFTNILIFLVFWGYSYSCNVNHCVIYV